MDCAYTALTTGVALETRGVPDHTSNPDAKGPNLPETTDRTQNLKPHFEDVQAHYDLSDDFFRLFLDPTQTYSCAYFERDDMTLEEAQIAKIDLSLGKLGLQPGMTLLDIGCGWGATMTPRHREIRRQRRRPDPEQEPAGPRRAAVRRVDSPRTQRVLLQGWEQFDEPVDRIVSIGAFEHFGSTATTTSSRWPTRASRRRRDAAAHDRQAERPRVQGARTEVDDGPLSFFKFIMDEIFPGGELP